MLNHLAVVKEINCRRKMNNHQNTNSCDLVETYLTHMFSTGIGVDVLRMMEIIMLDQRETFKHQNLSDDCFLLKRSE